MSTGCRPVSVETRERGRAVVTVGVLGEEEEEEGASTCRAELAWLQSSAPGLSTGVPHPDPR